MEAKRITKENFKEILDETGRYNTILIIGVNLEKEDSGYYEEYGFFASESDEGEEPTVENCFFVPRKAISRAGWIPFKEFTEPEGQGDVFYCIKVKDYIDWKRDAFLKMFKEIENKTETK